MQGFFYHGGGRFAGNALRLPHGKGHGRKEIIPQGADRFIGFIGDDGRLDALRLKALKKAKNAIIWFCGDVAVILVVGLELIEMVWNSSSLTLLAGPDGRGVLLRFLNSAAPREGAGARNRAA